VTLVTAKFLYGLLMGRTLSMRRRILKLKSIPGKSVLVLFKLQSGEFCKLRYDTIPVKSASVNFSFYTSNSKMPNFEL
jgi:hypothetical protein